LSGTHHSRSQQKPEERSAFNDRSCLYKLFIARLQRMTSLRPSCLSDVNGPYPTLNASVPRYGAALHSRRRVKSLNRFDLRHDLKT